MHGSGAAPDPDGLLVAAGRRAMERLSTATRLVVTLESTGPDAERRARTNRRASGWPAGGQSDGTVHVRASRVFVRNGDRFSYSEALLLQLECVPRDGCQVQSVLNTTTT